MTNKGITEFVGLAAYFAVAALAIAGIFLGFRREKSRTLLSLILMIFVFANLFAIVFLAGTRYRITMDPGFIVLAGYSISWVISRK